MEEPGQDMKKIHGLFKILSTLIKGNIITPGDYRTDYNNIIKTYHIWNEKMVPHPRRLFHFHLLLEKKRPLRILDFGCGMGYITRQILDFFEKQKYRDYIITGVDISEKFIGYCKKNIKGERITFVESHGIDFCKTAPTDHYDAIYCAWALPYFDHHILFPEFKRICKTGGIIGIVSNSKGTLRHIESAYMEVMMEHPASFHKIMDISFHLPRGKGGLNRWMKNAGFLPLFSGEKNVELLFRSPEELFTWLQESGALAGTNQLFYHPGEMKDEIIKKIKKKNKVSLKGKLMYKVNHRYVSGLYQKNTSGNRNNGEE
jgi:ubiquinone/menaquinone biosynthesis C-methylase UbiE